MPILDFDSPELESEFAAHLGYKYRFGTFGLSVVLCLTWITRFVNAQAETEIRHLWLMLGCFLVMASLHLFSTVAILRNPLVCCGEKSKAMVGVVDSLCCMVMVLLCSNRADVAHSSKPTRHIISTPFMILLVHGWAVLFGGFRLSAKLYLHLLNVQVYLFNKVHIKGTRSEDWPSVSTALLAFCICTLVPVMVGITMEANIRSSYLARRKLPRRHLGTFWRWLLVRHGQA